MLQLLIIIIMTCINQHPMELHSNTKLNMEFRFSKQCQSTAYLPAKQRCWHLAIHCKILEDGTLYW